MISTIIIAISMWCGVVEPTVATKEVKECRKTLFKCIKQKTTCSSCWSPIPSQVYESALSACIEENMWERN